jgi:endonuclease YncB( thermonuclease family)
VVRGSEAAAPSVRATFGLCKWGGGTDCVVDGDTFYIGGAKVRIAGIDAPETHDYRCASELALGDRATETLRALLNSGAVTMTVIDRDRDVYGRLLRNVQVDGADVGAAMVSAGVARAYGTGRQSWC